MATAAELAHQVESSGEGSQLSSPPHSTPEPGSPSAQLANAIANESSFQRNQQSSITVNPPPTSNGNGNGNENGNGPLLLGQPALPGEPEKPARRKPGRKPGWNKLLAAENNGTTEMPPKRTRRPRDPNAPPAQRRKRKTDPTPAPTSNATMQMMNGPPRADIQPRPSSDFPGPTLESQRGNNADINERPPPPHSFFAPPQPQPQHPFRTSGQNYDPIRSNYDPVRETVVLTHKSPYTQSQTSPVPPQHSHNRASASPSISSLVDPPNHALTSPSIAAQSFFHQQQQQQQVRYRDEGQTSLPPSPHTNRLAPAVVVESYQPKPPTPVMAAKKTDTNASASGQSTISKKMVGATSTATSSAAASPKPPKPKDSSHLPTPPPLPGSGLMQLGGSTDYIEFRAPTIVISLPMNGEGNMCVNFSRLAEEKYGWDAMNPRLASQRDRLARVAAVGAALERNGSGKESGDEMSLDSEAEGDQSNIEMGGMSDGRVGADGTIKKIPRKRRMKEDEYDKDDGFVDDTELHWEEHAAAANDGFFVYSGPLVPEKEKPAVELRADGAPKRGRGRGSRGGRLPGTSRATAAANREGLPVNAARGPRGGTTTRKPRMTKADRERMEMEKKERESMGALAMHHPHSNPFSGMAPLASAPSLGNTPMVFNQG